MCMPKAPKVQSTTQVIEAPPERQAPRAPTQAATLINSNERARRRQGYAALMHTPRLGLAPAATTATNMKTVLGG